MKWQYKAGEPMGFVVIYLRGEEGPAVCWGAAAAAAAACAVAVVRHRPLQAQRGTAGDRARLSLHMSITTTPQSHTQFRFMPAYSNWLDSNRNRYTTNNVWSIDHMSKSTACTLKHPQRPDHMYFWHYLFGGYGGTGLIIGHAVSSKQPVMTHESWAITVWS